MLALALAAGSFGCDRAANLIPGDAARATSTARPTPPPVVAPPILPPGKLLLGPDATSSAAQTVTDAQLAPSVVRVQGLQGTNITRSGSGVVVDATQRLVLTSYQVVEPFSADGSRPYSTLVVSVTRNVGEPASASFQAHIVRAEPGLGLAVLRVSRRLDGSPLGAGEFDLPAVALGDGVKINRGDPIRLLGYPSGDDPGSPQVLNDTEASLLGFRGDIAISGVAWLKTQARVDYGYNGAPVFDPQGRLLALTLQAGYSPTAPAGQLRPIGLAVRLIDEARRAGPEAVYAAPPFRHAGSSPGPVVTRPVFAENALEAAGGGDLFDYTEAFPDTLTTLNYEFVVQGATSGMLVEEKWFLNGVLQDGLSSSVPWSLGPFEVLTDRLRAPAGRTLQAGTWRLEVWADRQLRASAEAYVGVAQPRKPVVEGIQLAATANVDGGPRDSARGSAPQILATFRYANAGGVHQLRWVIFKDGRVVYQSPTVPWEGGEAGASWVGYSPGQSVGAGTWEVEVYFDNQIVASDGTRIF